MFSFEIPHGIDRGIIFVDIEIEVRAGDIARRADICDDLTALDLVADLHGGF